MLYNTVLSLGAVIVPVLAWAHESESPYELYRRDYGNSLDDLYSRDPNIDLDLSSRDIEQFDFPIHARTLDDLDDYLLKRNGQDAILYARAGPEQNRKGADAPPSPNPRRNPNLWILPPVAEKKDDKKAGTDTSSNPDNRSSVETPRQEQPKTPQHQIAEGTPSTPRTPFSPRERGHRRSTLSLSGQTVHHSPKSPKELAAILATSGADRATGPSPLSNQRYETNAFDAYQGPPPAQQGQRFARTGSTSPSGLRHSQPENQRSRSDSLGSMGSLPMDLTNSPPPSPSPKKLRRRADLANTNKEQIKDHKSAAVPIDKRKNEEILSVRYEDTVPATEMIGVPKVHEEKACALGRACNAGRKKLANLFNGRKAESDRPLIPNKEAGNGIQARDLIGDEEDFDLQNREAEIDDWNGMLQKLQARVATDEDWNLDDAFNDLITRDVDVSGWDDI